MFVFSCLSVCLPGEIQVYGQPRPCQGRIYAICNTVSIKNVLMLMIYGNHDASIKVYDGGDNVLLATP